MGETNFYIYFTPPVLLLKNVFCCIFTTHSPPAFISLRRGRVVDGLFTLYLIVAVACQWDGAIYHKLRGQFLRPPDPQLFTLSFEIRALFSLSKIPLTNFPESLVEYFLDISTASSMITFMGVSGIAIIS